MPFGRSTPMHRMILVIAFALLPWGTLMAQDVTEDVQLAEVMDAFTAQRAATAASVQRQENLRQSLDDFDARVEAAKKELEQASKKGSSLAEKIRAQQELLSALQDQRRRVAEVRGDLQIIALSFHDDLRRYARLVAARDIAFTESGPVFAGSILRPLLRPSLGESVDTFIERHAIIQTRRTLVSRLKTALYYTGVTEQRLHAVADDLRLGMEDLLAQREEIDAAVEEKRAFIDTSWKEKQLTERELREAAAEAAESSARLAEIQESLVTVNQQLKKQAMSALRNEVTTLQQRSDAIDTRRTELLRKDEAMRLLEEASLKAYAAAMDARNTDKKLYRRIEDRTRERTNLEQELARGVVDLGDGLGGTRPLSEEEIAADTARVAALTELLELMVQGIPEEQAQAYIDRRRTAVDATAERATIAEELAELRTQSAEVTKELSAKAVEIEQAERRYTLDDLPPSFAWPVIGPITAGFLDASYEKVFHFPHRAIDIAIPQGSIVRSIADGVVLAVRDGGATGYSYVLIGHRNGFASLYGHVSAFLVAEGDVVSLGQPIARSGGQPGTHGAGKSTTGPHVHLELTKDGQHVDPRSVLR